MGNPGTGKSTLLNSLIGRVVFRSGVSIATGLTSHVQWHEHEGVMYGDTPGLADVTHRTQAAREISKVAINKPKLAQLRSPNLDLNLDLDWVCVCVCVCVKALRAGGKFKILFVCTLESGRIQAADLTTIKLVLDAIGDNTVPFGIVVNKVSNSSLVNKQFYWVTA